MATAAALRQLLAPTSLPGDLIEEFLAETNALWLLGERDEVVAGEIVLCHPPLEPGEVRAVVLGTDRSEGWRITVVTWDRPGLLATTAAVLANDGLAVTDAAVTVLSTSRLAMQRVTVQRMTVQGPRTSSDGDCDWDRLGDRLRSALRDHRPVSVSWKPTHPVTVEAHPQGSGRVMVQVEAPDTIGLLWAITHQIDLQGANIEAARLGSDEGTAKDVFIVAGSLNAARLADALSETTVISSESPLSRILTAPLTLGTEALRRTADLLAAMRPGL